MSKNNLIKGLVDVWIRVKQMSIRFSSTYRTWYYVLFKHVSERIERFICKKVLLENKAIENFWKVVKLAFEQSTLEIQTFWTFKWE